MAKLNFLSKKRSGSSSKSNKLIILLIVLLVILVVIKMVASAFFYISLGIAIIIFAAAAWKIWQSESTQLPSNINISINSPQQ